MARTEAIPKLNSTSSPAAQQHILHRGSHDPTIPFDPKTEYSEDTDILRIIPTNTAAKVNMQRLLILGEKGLLEKHTAQSLVEMDDPAVKTMKFRSGYQRYALSMTSISPDFLTLAFCYGDQHNAEVHDYAEDTVVPDMMINLSMTSGCYMVEAFMRRAIFLNGKTVELGASAALCMPRNYLEIQDKTYTIVFMLSTPQQIGAYLRRRNLMMRIKGMKRPRTGILGIPLDSDFQCAGTTFGIYSFDEEENWTEKERGVKGTARFLECSGGLEESELWYEDQRGVKSKIRAQVKIEPREEKMGIKGLGSCW